MKHTPEHQIEFLHDAQKNMSESLIAHYPMSPFVERDHDESLAQLRIGVQNIITYLLFQEQALREGRE